MQLPTIHLNGTTARSLYESYAQAALEIQSALAALESVELNGRDYYPQGPEAYSKAAKEHENRCRQLKLIADEMQVIADHCQDYIK